MSKCTFPDNAAHFIIIASVHIKKKKSYSIEILIHVCINIRLFLYIFPP